MAKYVAKTQGELNKAIEKQVVAWLESLRILLPDLLKDYIEECFYNQFTPEYYQRKYRIIESVMASKVIKNGNTYSLEIYLDPDKVSYDGYVTIIDERGEKRSVFRKGDSPEYVFNLIAQGIHWSEDFMVTEGRFWEEFTSALDKGGTLDLFENFKTYLKGKGLLTVRF